MRFRSRVRRTRGLPAVLLFSGVLAIAGPTALIARSQSPSTGMQGGELVTKDARGPTREPVRDAQGRPITAGGFVEHGTVVFQDVTREAGLAGWSHVIGDGKKNSIIESLGGGVALLDYDGDGWLDIYLVNSLSYAAYLGKALPGHAALFRNNHDGTFTDVAAQAHVENDRWGVGAIAADFDNDGWPDLYVTNAGKNRLYRNNHDGTFTDVAEGAGVALGGWSTGATFGDYDGDGRLDLFVPGYTVYDFAHPPVAGSNAVVSNTCQFRGVATFCGPRGLKGEHDHLFHNNGDGTFRDVSVEAGVADTPGYYGLVSLFVDLDDDGRPDLLVGNDSTPNYLYRNAGGGKFKDVSFESGFAVNGDGRETATMGIAVGDYTNNGRLGIVDTDFSDDYKVLYRNDGKMSLTDVSAEAGIAAVSTPYLSWGDGFLDFDGDGWLDIFMVSGHVYPQVDEHAWGTSFREKPLLFHNLHGTKFAPVEAVTGTGLAVVITGRGAAFGDLFNDGRTDVVINNLDGSPTLLKNVFATPGHWLELKLLAGGASDAIGASAVLRAGGMVQRRDVLSGGSFASSSDPRVLFGLGKSATLEDLEVRWPDGTRQKVHLPGVDAIYTIHEGQANAELFSASATRAGTTEIIGKSKPR